jgi:hypothetical protein
MERVLELLLTPFPFPHFYRKDFGILKLKKIHYCNFARKLCESETYGASQELSDYKEVTES